jgi:hypothetical protein
MYHSRCDAARCRLIVATVATTLALLSGVSSAALPVAPDPWLAVDRNRTGIVAELVGRWGDVTKSGSAGVLSEKQLREALAMLRADHLFSATLAGTYAELLTVFAEAGALSGSNISEKPLHKVAGSGPELVYTPIVPCRIVDTRAGAGGFFAPGASRNWLASNPAGTFAAQGGSNSNCGIPVKAAAVTVNFTVFNTGAGPAFVTAWPFNQPQPGTATLNWTAVSSQVANGAILPLCTGAGCTADFSVFSSSATDMVVDVVGYFTPPSGGYTLSVAPAGAQYTSIQAAINAAAAVATATQHYLVKIAPGTYNEQITLKDYVDVEGSGRRTTRIQWNAGKPTVTVGAYAEFRQVGIFNTTAGAFPANGAVVVLQTAQSAAGNTRLADMNINALGSGDNAGVIVDAGVLVLVDVDVTAGVSSPLGAGGALGVSTDNASTVRLRNSRVYSFTSNAGFNAALERAAASLLLVNDTLVSGPIVGTPTCISVFNNNLQARTC